MFHDSPEGFEPIRAFATSVSLLALCVAAGPAWADDTAVEQVPPVQVESGKSVVPIGEPADAEGHADYIVTRSRTGSKTDAPNSSVPQHVTTVPKKVIDEQNDASIQETLKNVAGVTNTYPQYYPLDQWSSSYIRGFPVSMTLVDGLWGSHPLRQCLDGQRRARRRAEGTVGPALRWPIPAESAA